MRLLDAWLLFALPDFYHVHGQFSTITTFAGTGVSSTSIADGGAASSAAIYNPTAIAFDSSYIYFVSSGQNVVRRVSSSGIISRFAGTGSIT